MDNEERTLVSTQTVCNSSRLINILAINNRVYYVFVDSVSVSGVEIWRSKSRIVASCICGESIALVTEFGLLTIVSPETLETSGVPGILEERIGLTSHELVRRQVCATSSGQFVAVNVSKASVLIYEFDGSCLNFIRTINASEGGHFQLTGNIAPYLWHLYKTPDCYTVEVFEAGPFSPMSYPDVPVARLPVVPPKDKPASQSRVHHSSIHSCETESLEGILTNIDGAVMYLSLKRAIIGDVISGITWFPSEWSPSISTARVGGGSRMHMCHQINGKVVQLKSMKQGNEYEPTLSEAVGALHYELRSRGRCHIVVVDAQRESVQREDRNDSFGSENSDKDSQSYFKVIAEPFGSGRIKQLAIDTRKRPWRILTLSEGSLEARAPAIPVKVVANKLGAKNVSRVVYVRRLSLLLVSSTGEGNLRCFFSGATASNKEPSLNWSLKSLKCLEIPFNDLISAEVIGNHTMALVGSEGVQFRSAFSPFNELAYIKPAGCSSIIEAQFGDQFCVVRSIDHVCLISVEPGFPVSTLIEGLPVSFIRVDNSNLYVGVDITLWRDKQNLQGLVAGSRAMAASSHGPDEDSQRHINTMNGAIIHFERTANICAVSDLTLHDYIPTMYHRSTSAATDIIVYGYEGLVRHRRYRKKIETTLVYTHSPLQWAGVISEDTLLFIGLGIFVISPYGCEELIEASGKSRDSVISSAAVMSDEIIAYVANNELKFLAGSKFGDSHSPSILKTKLAPLLPKRVELNLLFVPSQRLVILHGENICMFYDSITFEQILVTGIAAAWCDSMTVWRFTSKGETFEHLLITNGRGLIESYSFSRDGPTLQCSCKYRAVVTQQSSAQRLREVLHCSDNAIYLGRKNEVIMAIPLPQHVTYRQSLRNEVRHISCAGPYLIVTTSKGICILLCDKLTQVATLALPEQVSEQLLDRKFEEEGVDVEIQKPSDTEILTHVATQIKNGSKSETSIFILCVVHSSSLKRYQGIMAEFKTNSKTLSFWDHTPKIRELSHVRNLEPDPMQTSDGVYSRLRAYAVTTDYRVVLVNVAPPENEAIPSELF